MTRRISETLNLRIRVFLFFALIGVLSVLAVVVAGLMLFQVLELKSTAPLVLYGGSALFVIVGTTLWVWLKFDEHVAQPILTIINDVQSTVHTGSNQKLAPETGKYLGILAPSVDQVISALAIARTGISEEVQRATKDAERLKRRLETVLRDLQDGVVICRMDHTILLYNKLAHINLTLGGNTTSGPGLGRNLTAFMAEWPLTHSLDRLKRRYASGRYVTHRDGLMTSFAAMTCNGTVTLMCRMSLMVDDQENSPHGYVITISNLTEELAAGVWRDRQMAESIGEMRQGVSNLSLAVETLQNVSELSAEELNLLNQFIEKEPEKLNRNLSQLEEVASDLLASAWPTSPIFSSTLFECVVSRMSGGAEIEIFHGGEELWLECDSASLVGLLSFMVEYLANVHKIKKCNFSLGKWEEQAFIDLEYEGDPVDLNNLKKCLCEPIDVSSGDLSGWDVLKRHKSELWPEKFSSSRSRLRMPVSVSISKETTQEAQLNKIQERPEFYDFDLFSNDLTIKLEETPLRHLNMVVFDTETTGLDPSEGDEIISIAAVRIVNGRILSGEFFDRLVNPCRRIPKSSTKIHKITEEMVRDEPTIGEILPQFFEFVDNAVLVAHNAPFDMAFLNNNVGKTGVKFSQPVLDTVLLAGHLFGSTEDLTLDALNRRMSIELDEKDRHTALGDSIATAKVLLGLIKLLEQRNIRTLGEATEVSKKQVAIRRKQVKY